MKDFRKKDRGREVNSRDNRKRFLLICEGKETEVNYFNALKDKLETNTVYVEVFGEGKNTVSLIDKALRHKAIAEKWAIFDKDGFPDKDFNDAIKKADKNDIKCAWSNQAFELWFILHFQNFENSSHRSEYREKIENNLKNHKKGFKYEKNNENIYDLLQLYGNEQEAIKRAKKLRQERIDENDVNFAKHNPCTTVYELVEELNKYKK
jgi:hypothetical protein